MRWLINCSLANDINSELTNKCVTEFIGALASIGFTIQIDSNTFSTEDMPEKDSLIVPVSASIILKNEAPTFCKYVENFVIYKIDSMSSNIALTLHD